MSAVPPSAEVNQDIVVRHDGPLLMVPPAYDSSSRTAEARIMCCELSDREWPVVEATLPNKPRGVSRVNDRGVLK
jgi:hypothetical protein